MAQNIAAARQLLDSVSPPGQPITLPKAVVICRRIWDQYEQQVFDGQDPPEPREPTNDEVGGFTIQKVKEFIFGLNVSIESTAAGQSATESRRAEVTAELIADLGPIIE